MNDDGVKLRKNENMLLVSGMGVCAFSLWSVVKLIMSMIFSGDTASASVEELSGIDIPDEILAVLAIGILLVALLDIVLRLYVGRSAWKYALLKKKSCAFIFLAFLLLFVSILGAVLDTASFDLGDIDKSVDTAATLLVDITSAVTLILMIHSGLVVKKLRG